MFIAEIFSLISVLLKKKTEDPISYTDSNHYGKYQNTKRFLYSTKYPKEEIETSENMAQNCEQLLHSYDHFTTG